MKNTQCWYPFSVGFGIYFQCTNVASYCIWLKLSLNVRIISGTTLNRAFFDLRVFNPLAPFYGKMSLAAAHSSNENSKKREYNERVLQVEHGSFTPLVFSCLGGMSVECSNFYNRISDRLAEKRNIEPSRAKSWLRTKLNFCLLRTTNMCIRGSRTKLQEKEALKDTNIQMAMVDARITE